MLALAPLAEAGLIEDVVIDAKSGVSGAGRGAAEEMEVVKSSDDAKPYKVGGPPPRARDRPGADALAAAAQRRAALTFVPHLMPFDQGELVSCLRAGRTRASTPDELPSSTPSRYADEPFVEMVAEPPGVGDVRGTNLCRIHVRADPEAGRVMVFAAIDNLWKGAASQAVQNLNLMLGLPEGEGIS